MSRLAPSLEAYFTQRLIGQRRVSPNTVAAYRDAWRLLLQFVQAKAGKEPSELDITDLDAPAIVAFLDHLEQERHNGIRTRNARLAAVRSFFRFAALRHPEHAAVIARVLDIPAKRCQMKEVDYLDRDEIHALIAAPDRASWCGRRDHALLSVAAQTGLRVSELTGLRGADVELGTGAHVRCRGKGRKERCTPLGTHTVALLRVWLQERGGGPDDPLPDPPGLVAHPQRCQVPRGQARRHRGSTVPIAANQAHDASYPAPQLCDGIAALRCRFCGDRTLARPRAGSNDRPHVHPRRSGDQRTRSRPHPPGDYQAGALQASGRLDGIPRCSLTGGNYASEIRQDTEFGDPGPPALRITRG